MVDSSSARVLMRNPQVVSSSTPDNIVAMSVPSGDCYAFAGPSARIWELLERPISMTEIVSTLVREFEITESACDAEVAAYLARLEQERLVVAVAN